MAPLSPFTPKSHQKRDFLKPHSFKTLSWPLLGPRRNSRAGSGKWCPLGTHTQRQILTARCCLGHTLFYCLCTSGPQSKSTLNKGFWDTTGKENNHVSHLLAIPHKAQFSYCGDLISVSKRLS